MSEYWYDEPCQEDTQLKSLANPGVVGLSNLGNTCFLNVTLQCLNVVDPFTEYLSTQLCDQLRSDSPHGAVNQRSSPLKQLPNSTTDGSKRLRVAGTLAILLRSIWSRQYDERILKQFHESLGKYEHEYQNRREQDAHEFLLLLLNLVDEELKLTDGASDGATQQQPSVLHDLVAVGNATSSSAGPDKTSPSSSMIENIFGGVQCSQVMCPNPSCRRSDSTTGSQQGGGSKMPAFLHSLRNLNRRKRSISGLPSSPNAVDRAAAADGRSRQTKSDISGANEIFFCLSLPIPTLLPKPSSLLPSGQSFPFPFVWVPLHRVPGIRACLQPMSVDLDPCDTLEEVYTKIRTRLFSSQSGLLEAGGGGGHPPGSQVTVKSSYAITSTPLLLVQTTAQGFGSWYLDTTESAVFLLKDIQANTDAPTASSTSRLPPPAVFPTGFFVVELPVAAVDDVSGAGSSPRSSVASGAIDPVRVTGGAGGQQQPSTTNYPNSPPPPYSLISADEARVERSKASQSFMQPQHPSLTPAGSRSKGAALPGGRSTNTSLDDVRGGSLYCEEEPFELGSSVEENEEDEDEEDDPASLLQLLLLHVVTKPEQSPKSSPGSLKTPTVGGSMHSDKRPSVDNASTSWLPFSFPSTLLVSRMIEFDELQQLVLSSMAGDAGLSLSSLKDLYSRTEELQLAFWLVDAIPSETRILSAADEHQYPLLHSSVDSSAFHVLQQSIIGVRSARPGGSTGCALPRPAPDIIRLLVVWPDEASRWRSQGSVLSSAPLSTTTLTMAGGCCSELRKRLQGLLAVPPPVDQSDEARTGSLSSTVMGPDQGFSQSGPLSRTNSSIRNLVERVQATMRRKPSRANSRGLSQTDSTAEVKSQLPGDDGLLQDDCANNSEITLLQCFTAYTASQQLGNTDAWYCPDCRSLQPEATLRQSLIRMPNYLFIHLKRFQQTASGPGAASQAPTMAATASSSTTYLAGGIGEAAPTTAIGCAVPTPPPAPVQNKLNNFVSFPVYGLDLEHLVRPPSSPKARQEASRLPGGGGATHPSAESPDASSRNCLTYDLIAVCNHVGSIDSGHYTAYCRSPVDGKWRSFNDQHVYELSEDKIVRSSAYILLYQRRKAPDARIGGQLDKHWSSCLAGYWQQKLTREAIAPLLSDTTFGSLASASTSSRPLPLSPPVSPALNKLHHRATGSHVYSTGGALSRLAATDEQFVASHNSIAAATERPDDAGGTRAGTQKNSSSAHSSAGEKDDPLTSPRYGRVAVAAADDHARSLAVVGPADQFSLYSSAHQPLYSSTADNMLDSQQRGNDSNKVTNSPASVRVQPDIYHHHQYDGLPKSRPTVPGYPTPSYSYSPFSSPQRSMTGGVTLSHEDPWQLNTQEISSGGRSTSHGAGASAVPKLTKLPSYASNSSGGTVAYYRPQPVNVVVCQTTSTSSLPRASSGTLVRHQVRQCRRSPPPLDPHPPPISSMPNHVQVIASRFSQGDRVDTTTQTRAPVKSRHDQMPRYYR